MQTDLRPFFHNESALKALVQMRTHLWEYGVILDMQPALWFSNGLGFLIEQFNKAKECDKSAVQRSLAFWFPPSYECDQQNRQLAALYRCG